MPLPRIIDASEVRLLPVHLDARQTPFADFFFFRLVSQSGSKAAQFLPFFKRAGRHAAVVDFVAAGSRFKVLLPKEEKKLTFVLAGIREYSSFLVLVLVDSRYRS